MSCETVLKGRITRKLKTTQTLFRIKPLTAAVARKTDNFLQCLSPEKYDQTSKFKKQDTQVAAINYRIYTLQVNTGEKN